jgi:hypothetical protein
MARRTAAARLCLLPQCPHSPADTRSDSAREHSPLSASSNRPECAPHQWTTKGHGERLTRQRSRLTALGCCGESPNDAAVRCCGRYGSCDTVTRGCTQWSARGRRALLNDLARQGNPSGISHSSVSWDCQGGGGGRGLVSRATPAPCWSRVRGRPPAAGEPDRAARTGRVI